MTRVCARVSLVALSLGLAACGGSAARTEVPAASSTKAAIASESAVDRPSEPATAEADSDPTLSPAEYEARGMPSIQNPWTAIDYQLAAAALVAIAEENPAHLPRLNSKQSGPVFRRIVSREDLLVYANRNIDWDLRRASLMAIHESMLSVLAVYARAFSANRALQREILELSVKDSHSVIAMWNLVDELPKDLLKKTARNPSPALLLDELQDGTPNMVRATVLLIELCEENSVPTCIWHAGELIHVLPPLIERITPERQAEARQRIAKLAASEPNPALAKQFKLLHEAVAAP
ncbi:MAG: hypothetical protein IPM54_21315 [Polyangiaceae bacterium]|nr:hypothetical protein [Polyangiaceae bacterium]